MIIHVSTIGQTAATVRGIKVAEDALIRELSAAVERTPDALGLRLHLAELLLADGRYAEALSHCSTALTQDSANTAALALLQRCSAALAAPAGVAPGTKPLLRLASGAIGGWPDGSFPGGLI